MKAVFFSFMTMTFLLATSSHIAAQNQSPVPENRKYYLGSSFFVPYGLTQDPSPEFYQLNLGYRLDQRNALSVELITWKYQHPLGIPFGPDYDNEINYYPGEVQSFGGGLSYQRFFWKGLYGQVHSLAFHQNYLDTDDKKIQSGFMLFNVFRIGYHIEFFKKRFFIEPSVAMTWWPILTNLPDGFKKEEERWNKTFWGEPGLHFGINF